MFIYWCWDCDCDCMLLEIVVWKMLVELVEIWGLYDCGVLCFGMCADVNVIDFDVLLLYYLEFLIDLFDNVWWLV